MKLEQISLHKTEGAVIRRARLGGVNRTNVALAIFPTSRNEITPTSPSQNYELKIAVTSSD